MVVTMDIGHGCQVSESLEVINIGTFQNLDMEHGYLS